MIEESKMPFLDLNGDGKIDEEETVIGIAILDEDEEDERKRPPKGNNNSGCGCLTITLAVICLSAIVGILTFLL